MIALLSAILIKEPVTKPQWGGVFLGFLGVIAILRPGTDALFVVHFATAPGGRLLCARHGSYPQQVPGGGAASLALALHGTFVVTGLIATAVLALLGLDAETKAAFPFLLGDWAPMEQREWGLMALLAVLSVAYFFGVARAYQIAAPSIIATFDYAYLVSAALWGFVFFCREARSPDAWRNDPDHGGRLARRGALSEKGTNRRSFRYRASDVLKQRTALLTAMCDKNARVG